MKNAVYFHLILIFGFSGIISNDIIDLTDFCNNNLSLNYYLTYGMGFIDGTVLTIHSVDKNCIVNFHSGVTILKSKIVQIIVIESLKNLTNSHDNGHSSDCILVIDANGNIINAENSLNEFGFFAKAFPANRTKLVLHGKSSPLKLTATSARGIREFEKCKDSETICRIDQTFVCIDNELICDGNINCGEILKQDESSQTCEPDNRMRQFLLVMTSTLVAAFILLGLTRLLCTFIPKIPKFNFRVSSRDNRLLLTGPNERITLATKDIKETNVKSARVLYRGRASGDSNIDNDTSEMEMQTYYYPGDNVQPTFTYESKRLTTNTPVLQRQMYNQYIKETFGREIVFLSDAEGKRHKLKKDSTIFFSS